MENAGLSIRGVYRDVLTAADGTVLLDTGWKENQIVEECHILIARLMRLNYDKDTISGNESGILKLAVGEGEASWDLDGTPSPEKNVTKLVNEGGIISINYPEPNTALEVSYLDGPVSAGIEIKATLGNDFPKETLYPLREFGLFGQAPTGHDTYIEYMINCIYHPVIQKDSDTTLIRTLHIYF